MIIDKFFESTVGIIWGLPLVFLIVFIGIILIIISKGLPLLKISHAYSILQGKYTEKDQPGLITHFQAMSASLSGTVGLGNIAGVSVAIISGGPGSIVWMWLIGIIGMFIRFFTCTLAVKYRKVLPDGTVLGGTMQVIEQGLGKRWKPLSMIFAFFVIIASFGGGTMFQSNQLSVAMNYYFSIPKVFIGIVLSILVALVILGGIKRIGLVAAKIVPFMCIIYVIGALIVILIHISEIPSMILLIIKDAFTGQAIAGGILGTVIVQGVKRAVFSSEVGLGSAPIAHAAVKTNQPVRQGLVAMLDPCIDILIICTMTALVVTISGVYNDSNLISQASLNSDLKGIIITSEAFNQSIPGFGKYFVSIAVFFFAFTSIISWAYYGEQGCLYLLGRFSVIPYRLFFIVVVSLGAIWKFGPVINFSDTMFGLMVIPTLLSTVLLSGQVMKMAKSYFSNN